MTHVNYNYTNENLLTKPQKYHLSLFFGLEFLSAYVENRRKKIINFPKTSILIEEELIAKLNLKYYENYGTKKLSKYESTSLLSWILFHLITSADNIILEYYITLLVKKFEIKKRIHSVYSNELKELSDDFTILHNYLLLSLICIIKYERTLNLKFLNTALKINDVLCSQTNQVINSIDTDSFVYSLEKEISCIKQLCETMKIRFEK